MGYGLWAMSNGYSDTLTLDRIDVNGDYCPANCRWATRKEQSNNKRNLHIIEHKGETKTLTEWSKTLNIPISTLYRYLASEKSLEKAREFGVFFWGYGVFFYLGILEFLNLNSV